MGRPTATGTEKLRSDILAQARQQCEEILSRARETAGHVVAKAQEEAQEVSRHKLQAARSEAKRRQEAILSTIALEANRLRLAQIERLLVSIHDSVLDRLRRGEGFERRAALANLAVAALAKMNGNGFLLRLSSSDLRALGDGLPEEIRRRWARPWLKLEVGEDPEARPGDWTLQDEEGRQIWELGLEPRLERVWPDLRRQIATATELVDRQEPGES